MEVTDDVFSNDHEDEQIWRGDSLQFLINPYRQEIEGRGQYEFAMGLGKKGNRFPAIFPPM